MKSDSEEKTVDEKISAIADIIRDEIKRKTTNKELETETASIIVSNVSEDSYDKTVEKIAKVLKRTFAEGTVSIIEANENHLKNKTRISITMGENEVVFEVGLGYIDFDDTVFPLDPQGLFDFQRKLISFLI